MIKASLRNKLFSNEYIISASGINLSNYNLIWNRGEIEISKSGRRIAATDCLNYLEYPYNEKWEIERRSQGLLFDKVVNDRGEELFTLERNYRPKGYSIFNNYTKVTCSKERYPIMIVYRQWKLFYPIKVEAFSENISEPDILVINLALAWMRYEYNTHDQMY